jgi:hypothetical protein
MPATNTLVSMTATRLAALNLRRQQ